MSNILDMFYPKPQRGICTSNQSQGQRPNHKPTVQVRPHVVNKPQEKTRPQTEQRHYPKVAGVTHNNVQITVNQSRPRPATSYKPSSDQPKRPQVAGETHNRPHIKAPQTQQKQNPKVAGVTHNNVQITVNQSRPRPTTSYCKPSSDHPKRRPSSGNKTIIIQKNITVNKIVKK